MSRFVWSHYVEGGATPFKLSAISEVLNYYFSIADLYSTSWSRTERWRMTVLRKKGRYLPMIVWKDDANLKPRNDRELGDVFHALMNEKKVKCFEIRVGALKHGKGAANA